MIPSGCYRRRTYTTEPTLPTANLRYQVALHRRNMDKRRKPVPLLSAPFARAVMVVQWYDQRLNSLATRVRIPLHASGIRDTVWVLSPPNLHNRTNAPKCQPSLPSRSRTAQNGQKAEANSPFVRAFCSSCHGDGHHDDDARHGPARPPAHGAWGKVAKPPVTHWQA